MPYCPNCGSEIGGDEAFCPVCGDSVADVGGGTGGERPPGDGGGTDEARHARPGETRRGGNGRVEPGRSEQASGSDGVSRRELLAVGGGGAALGGAGLFVLLSGGGSGSPGAAGGDGGSRPPPLDQVEVRIVDARTPDAGVTSATIPILIAFHNPTDRMVSTLTGDFDVFVNGTRVGSDEIVVNRLEPGEETHYDLEVIVEYADIGSAIVSAIRSGSFELRLVGTLNAGEAHREVTLTRTI